MTEQLSNAINLATIANWIIIIGVAALIYFSYTLKRRHVRRAKGKSA